MPVHTRRPERGPNPYVDVECSPVTVAEPAHPGTYWLVTAPSTASDLTACGARYTAHVETIPIPWEATEVGLGVSANPVGNWDEHPVDYQAADIWADERDLAYVANRNAATIDIMDLFDFIWFQDCFRGDGDGLVAPDCDIHDFDADTDVDSAAYAGFFTAQTGPR